MIAPILLAELDHEAATTRKVFERLPDNLFTYKPTEKSGTLGWTAAHIAQMLEWGAVTMKTESFDINPPGGPAYQPPKADSQAELLAMFEKNLAAFRAAIQGASDADFMAPWSLLSGGQVAFTMPRGACIRSMIMNHIVHHRGQLTVYMRLNGIPIPSIYGPSGDEPM
ncbi:MAG: DinB family protein [Acidobacteria bacterium]|nr:DinB family protein [Acidobacteriota bacterium]